LNDGWTRSCACSRKKSNQYRRRFVGFREGKREKKKGARRLLHPASLRKFVSLVVYVVELCTERLARSATSQDQRPRLSLNFALLPPPSPATSVDSLLTLLLHLSQIQHTLLRPLDALSTSSTPSRSVSSSSSPSTSCASPILRDCVATIEDHTGIILPPIETPPQHSPRVVIEFE
jgi:hypothetical protein